VLTLHCFESFEQDIVTGLSDVRNDDLGESIRDWKTAQD